MRVFYEVYGHGVPTVLFLPPWSVVHARCWKLQIPYFARRGRVVVFDPRGNGRSDRPAEPEAYAATEFAADALAVLDATETLRAFAVGWSTGARRALLLATSHAQRVDGIVFVAPTLPLAPQPWDSSFVSFDSLEEFLQFFFAGVFTEPHSTRQIEDGIGWGLETTAETLAATYAAPLLPDDPKHVRDLARSLRCPSLVIHGTDDLISACETGAALAELTGGELAVLEGSGHGPHLRDPVRVNLLIRDFLRRHA